MYKSPIEVIYKDAQYKLEENIYKAIQKVDIKVDRDELLKALAYDRGQYEKGYADALADRAKGKWIKRGKIFQCSECEKFSITQDNYCSNCGADMREEQTDEKTIL